jgi:nucleoside-diphosphate-sugar epimerase
MKILLTGCTGFVGRFVLREMLTRLDFEKDTVVCLLRAKKGHSVHDRWASEICSDSLFFGFADILAKVQIQEGDLDHLAGIQWPADQKPDLIVHCAANVKTLDTYANLYADNVLGVKNICEAAIQWSCSKLVLISTCYVHPKTTVGKATLLPADLPQSLFTTDYTYTKYLGEHVAATYQDKLQISLLRLSCVGAPCGWLDAHPTPGAMAHLGILSLMIRGRLLYVRLPSTMYLSTIPVDIVARSIVDTVATLQTSDLQTLQIQQVCVKPEDSTWNLSMPHLIQTLKHLAPKLPLQIVDCSEAEFVGKLRSFVGWSAWTPWGYKVLRFHEEVNNFITQFADGQRFESTVPDAYFPQLQTKEAAYEQTCFYVARGNHQHLIEKGVPKAILDKFWTNLPSHDIIGRIGFREPIEFQSREEAISRVYDCFASYRPFFGIVENPSVLKYQDNTRLAVRFASESDTIQLGCNPWTKASCYLELEGSGSTVKAIRMMGHHGIGDGTALIGVLPRINSLHLALPSHTFPEPSIKPSSLSWIQEFACFMYYIAAFIILFFRPADREVGDKKQRVVSRTIATTSKHIEKHSGKTFTVSLLEKTYPVFRAACNKETIIYCIPAVVQNPKERGLNLPQNVFVPLILPFTSNSDENAIAALCMKSKAVKMLSWLFVYGITATDLYGIRDRFHERIDVIFSSLLASETNLDSVESFHYFAPTPDEVPFTVSAMTIGRETHLSVGSSMKEYSASSLLDQILV